MSQNPRAKLEYSLKLFNDAVLRLEEALSMKPESENSLIIDGTIQRFEFSYEMSWKTLRRFLEFKGVVTKTPRDTFKEAFKIDWIKNDDLWSQMIEDRNRTSHTYNRELARSVYQNIGEYLKLFQSTNHELSKVLLSIEL